MAKPFPKVPTPGRLFPILPWGFGSSQVESLTGFLSRLAQAHRIPLWVLVTRELAPYFRRKTITDGRGQCDLFAKSGASLNGVGTLAEEAVDLIEHLSRSQNLSNLTLLPLKEIISPRSSIRLNRAWCPYCYLGWLRRGEPMRELLLWQIEAARVCPFHPHHYLRIRCPNCNSSQRPLARYSTPGYCSKCSAWLGIPVENQKNEMPSLTDQMLSAEVGSLVESLNTGRCRPNLAILRNNLLTLRKQVFHDSTLAFANASGLHHSSAADLVNGRSRPGLETVLKISVISKTPAADLLTNRIGRFAIETKHTADFRRKQCQSYDWLKMRRRLQQILVNGDQTISLHAVCRSEGADPGYVAKRLPKLAMPIVQAFRHSCSQRHRNRLRKEESAFCGVVREMIAANQWPSHRKLKSRLQKPGMLRNPALVNLRREILFPKKMPEEGKFDR